jgi:regulatory protein
VCGDDGYLLTGQKSALDRPVPSDDAQRPTPRPPGKVTAAYLERAALAYLERYASSAENLRRVLTRKVERRCRLRDEEPGPFMPLVETTVRRTVESGLVDDRRYAEARAASLRRRGGSARLIRAKLAAKGVEREAAAAALADDTDDAERVAAEALARRRRLGPYRTRDRAAHRDRDMAALARAGFPYGLARSVIDGEGDLPPEPT